MATMIGPYRFTDTDIRKTLGHAVDLLDLAPVGARPALLARRARVTAALRGADAAKGDPSELGPMLARVWPELLGMRHDLMAAGALPPRAAGAVSHLAVSGGGVPKRRAERVVVDHGGVVGDRQGARNHHGRPWQALCLWSAEVLGELAAAGHPIGPGSAGENVTVSGLDWTTVTPGCQLRLGSVLCQVSAYAIPCAKNAQWFSDRDISRIHHANGPLSRLYATVLEPGSIAIGAAAVLEPS
jgi:MOSC domain